MRTPAANGTPSRGYRPGVVPTGVHKPCPVMYTPCMETTENTRPVPAADVQAGDTLSFLGRSHRITRLEEYTGPLEATFTAGARVAYVEGHERGFMTLDNDSMVRVAR